MQGARRKEIKNSLLTFLLFWLLSGPAAGRPQLFRIGYICDGPHYYSRLCWEQFQKELSRLEGDDFNFTYPGQFQVVDHFRPEEIEEQCRRLLASPRVDLIMGMGLDTAAFFVTQTQLSKPVVLYGPMDIELSGLETAAGISPLSNLTFQVQRDKIPRELARIKQLARGRDVTALIDPSLLEDIPGLERKARELSRKLDLPLRFAFYAPTVSRTLRGLPPETGFIYLTPSRYFNTRQKLRDLLEGLNRRKIPTFAMEGTGLVELGALAALYQVRVEKIARNAALKVYEIVRGSPPEELSVYYRDQEDFSINLATARRIGYYPDFDILLEARLINEEIEEGPMMTFRTTAAIALKSNLSYQIARRELEEERQEYREVLASLFPRLDASAAYRRIDTDRAQASAGLFSRWETFGSLKLEQLIFNYGVWQSVALARLSVSAAERELEQTKLDTTESALLAYLSVLQARELLRVQRENLLSTRNHLETARGRFEQEVGGRGDVLRWEVQYQEVLAEVIESGFDLKKASLVFNETLNRPLEAPFRLERLRADGYSTFSGGEIDRIITNYRQSDLLRAFLVETGKELSPEMALARLNLKIAEEDLTRSRAEIWSPSVGARFEYTRKFDEEVWNPNGTGGGSWGGAGDYPDDDEWTVAGFVTLPLWTGGSRWADLKQKKIALRKAGQALQLQEQSTSRSIRTAYFSLAASSTSWELNLKREELARKSLALVEDKYRKGTLPIINLLDAQSDYVSAQAATVSALYSSVSDLITLERATGFIEYLESPKDVGRFIGEMAEYIEGHSPKF